MGLMGSNQQRPARLVKKMEATMDVAQKAFDKFSSVRLELDSMDDRPEEILGIMFLGVYVHREKLLVG